MNTVIIGDTIGLPIKVVIDDEWLFMKAIMTMDPGRGLSLMPAVQRSMSSGLAYSSE